jgi:outer membrane lipoprotein carrier protein
MLRLHVLSSGNVKTFVRGILLSVALLAVSAFAADAPLNTVLKDIESRYNHARTLQVLFTEQYTPKGGIQRTESGTLLLRKPGRMRWEYAQPKGKLVVSDGTFLYIYTPAGNRAQKVTLKDSMAEEMQAPLAFLLGKLNFDKEFKNLQALPEGSDLRITGQPKNENLPYSAVDFVVTSQNQIRKLRITLPDYTLEFAFSMEKMDPPADAKLFAFQLPAGAQWDEVAH